ncbi:MAG: TonB family protein [Candidatus Zixiibacteriota bacterium]|nr:MAG: TonB family protein [candidate division Zixibacteria bacterium]
MKTHLLGFAISVLLTATVGLAIAGERVDSGMESSGIVPPQLSYSVRPHPVEYAPGRAIEGYVTLEMRVGTDGLVKSVRVLYRTSNLAVNSAVRAAQEWKFAPALKAGKAVESTVVYSLPFGANLPLFANAEYPVQWHDSSGGESTPEDLQVTQAE